MMFKRITDFGLSLVLILLLFWLTITVAILVKLTSAGPAIYWSDRIGKDNKIFTMPKFRTMRIDTPVVATHLMKDADSYKTPVGNFLRRTSLDEIPQLYSILKGDMSFVGPRPALFNQADLIALRTKKGVHKVVPGLTGWAQVNGRDTLPIAAKVELDAEYVARQSFYFDLKILFFTIVKVVAVREISH